MASEGRHLNIVGRLAPSPTGALHLGNARSFLLAWWSARQQGGRVLLRIEDIDSPRVKPWAFSTTMEDLRWLGLDWDAGPESDSVDQTVTASGDGRMRHVQSQRLERYRSVLQELIARRLVYRCRCSRSDVTAAASAPHDDTLQPLEGQVYPETCRGRAWTADELEGKFAWRWALEDGRVCWQDAYRGSFEAEPRAQLGDFVVARSDGTPAYQLAVVVDDMDMGVTEVVRGDDLVFSTFRQLAILKALGGKPPVYRHVPLIVGPDGRRLAKRHGDTRLQFFRDQGVTAEAVVGYLAFSLGLLPEPEPVVAQDLVDKLDWNRISPQPTTFDLRTELDLLRSLH